MLGCRHPKSLACPASSPGSQSPPTLTSSLHHLSTVKTGHVITCSPGVSNWTSDLRAIHQLLNSLTEVYKSYVFSTFYSQAIQILLLLVPENVYPFQKNQSHSCMNMFLILSTYN